eukprot:289214-Pelagomonas_calceolata.AAC.1
MHKLSPDEGHQTLLPDPHRAPNIQLAPNQEVMHMLSPDEGHQTFLPDPHRAPDTQPVPYQE